VILFPPPNGHGDEHSLIAVDDDSTAEDRPNRKHLSVVEGVGSNVDAAPNVETKDSAEGICVILDARIAVNVAYHHGASLSHGPVEGGVLSARSGAMLVQHSLQSVLQRPIPTRGLPYFRVLLDVTIRDAGLLGGAELTSTMVSDADFRVGESPMPLLHHDECYVGLLLGRHTVGVVVVKAEGVGIHHVPDMNHLFHAELSERVLTKGQVSGMHEWHVRITNDSDDHGSAPLTEKKPLDCRVQIVIVHAVGVENVAVLV